MKYIRHFTCGIIVGILQYILVTGFSYMLLKANVSTFLLSVLYVFCHGVVVFIAVGNILYKTDTFSALFLRIATSIFSFFLIMLGFAHLGVISQLEKLLDTSSNAQNVQGLICLSFLFWISIASVFMVVVKSVALYQAHRKDT